MSGWCSVPGTDEEHSRCVGGNAANPDKEWQPCPCPCHLTDEYECGCGRPIREAPLWRDLEEDEDAVYVHIEPKTGRAVGEVCP